MKNVFFKFPTTSHLTLFDGTKVRDDKVMLKCEQNELLLHKLVVEEKVDGANLGISFDHEGNMLVQNRGEYLHSPYSGQWKKLSEWLNPRTDMLFEQLTDKYILFGEWCYAEHSVGYDKLPDWFLGFDIFDKVTAKFFSCSRRNAMFDALQIFHVPMIAQGKFTLSELNNLLSQSQLSDKLAEGLYLRFDQGDWLKQRAKLVRPGFIQSIEQHWSRSAIKANRLKREVGI